jgi:hypothetical protein
MYTQALTSLTIPPGGSKTFKATWRQVDNSGDAVHPGRYTIKAQLTPISEHVTPVTTQVSIGSNPKVSKVTVDNILKRAKELSGTTVSVSGTYLGWKVDSTGNSCKMGPPVSRTDWGISDRTGCIFAHGPSGLDPQKDRGKQISVVGTIAVTKDGQPYLEVNSVRTANQ